MKKLFFALALIAQTAVVSAATLPVNRPVKATITYAKYENVHIFQQASTASKVVKSLKSTDAVIFIRKYNSQWTIVTAGDKVGYILTSELKINPAEEKATLFGK